MKTRFSALMSLIVVSMFLAGSLVPVCSASADPTTVNADVDVCELAKDDVSAKFKTVAGAVSYWNDYGQGDYVLTIYETTSYEGSCICEDPINIVQKKINNADIDRSLKIVGDGIVVMKPTAGSQAIFTVSASSDFAQTPSITFENIIFDMSESTVSCFGVYANGISEERYIRGLYFESCTFLGNTSIDCVGIGTTANGSADFIINNCKAKDVYRLFSGYCFKRLNDYGLYISNCTSTNGKYFVNNQSGEHTTCIKDCVADYYGGADDSYGIRTRGSSLYMENVTLTYKGSYGSNFDAFVVVKSAKNTVKELSITNCVFNGFDNVTDVTTAGNNKKDVYVESGSVDELKIDGVSKGKLELNGFYNMPRYTASIGSSTGGTATVSDGHNVGQSVKVMKGAVITLNVAADNTYLFDSWNAPGVTIDIKNQFVMIDSDVTVTPSFTSAGATTYNVNVTGGTGGSVSPSKSVVSGEEYYLVVKADDGYAVDDVVVNGESKGAVGMLTISVTQNTTIEVSFRISPGTITEVDEEYESVKETTKVEYKDGSEETIEKTTDSNANVIYSSEVKSGILDVVTTAVQGDTEEVKGINEIESKITIASTVSEKTAKVIATDEYLAVADKQIQSIVDKTGMPKDDPVYLMNIKSEGEYDKISAEFSKDIVGSIDGNDGVIAISSDDTEKKGCSSVVIDRSIVGGLANKTFDTMNLVIGQSEKEDLSPEQQEVVGDNIVVHAKMILTKSDGTTEEVKTLGGTATVSLHYESAAEDPNISVYYVATDGSTQLMENVVYDPISKTVTFQTTHFSEFVIVDEGKKPTVIETVSELVCWIVAIALVLILVESVYDYRYEKKQ